MAFLFSMTEYTAITETKRTIPEIYADIHQAAGRMRLARGQWLPIQAMREEALLERLWEECRAARVARPKAPPTNGDARPSWPSWEIFRVRRHRGHGSNGA